MSCSTSPALLMASTYFIELPSKIGNSGASTSIKQLSTPNAYKAAIACSTVLTSAVPLDNTVPR